MVNRPPTPEERDEILRNLPWVQHADCVWMQIGPCVYCVDHDMRLYQGKLPPTREGAST